MVGEDHYSHWNAPQGAIGVGRRFLLAVSKVLEGRGSKVGMRNSLFVASKMTIYNSQSSSSCSNNQRKYLSGASRKDFVSWLVVAAVLVVYFFDATIIKTDNFCARVTQ